MADVHPRENAWLGSCGLPGSGSLGRLAGHLTCPSGAVVITSRHGVHDPLRLLRLLLRRLLCRRGLIWILLILRLLRDRSRRRRMRRFGYLSPQTHPHSHPHEFTVVIIQVQFMHDVDVAVHRNILVLWHMLLLRRPSLLLPFLCEGVLLLNTLPSLPLCLLSVDFVEETAPATATTSRNVVVSKEPPRRARLKQTTGRQFRSYRLSRRSGWHYIRGNRWLLRRITQ
mmetsp:Transcript_3731/g.8234  ORF Transcript_3731/g.8234 Transcript_3731/m.8234 type:complete len:227 (-) Transcript_3731:240-920(-)